MEVLLERYKGTRLLGRLPAGFRGYPRQLLDQLRPVVRRAGQQKMVPQPRRRPHHRRHTLTDRPAISSGGGGIGEGRDTGLERSVFGRFAKRPYGGTAICCAAGGYDVVAGGPEVEVLLLYSGGHHVGEEVWGAGEGGDAEVRERGSEL